MKKRVLITGASRGIGRGIALACAKQGYDLILTCVNEIEKLREVEQICSSMGSSCLLYQGDIGDSTCVAELFTMIENKWEGIDVLINNAGISYIGLLTDMTDEEWNRMIQTNLSSVFYCARAAVPYMVRQKKGRIINISSMWGNVGASCEVAYSATKGGVNSFTKALAKELAPSNIQVNALALGVIDTEMNHCFSEDERNALIEEIPMGRMGMPEEVGDMIVSMIEGPAYLTGQVITVDGGYL